MSLAPRQARKFFGGLLVVVIMLSASFFYTGKALAINALNPNPVNVFGVRTIPDFAYDYLANCDSSAVNPSGKNPAFQAWLSSPDEARNDVTGRTFTATSGGAVVLQFNWSGAVCSSRAAVYQTQARFLASPGVGFLPATTGMNFTSAGGAGNFNAPGTYRGVSHKFAWVAPTGLAPGTYAFNVPITFQSINQFRSGAFLCVGGSEQRRSSIGDFGDPNAGGCISTTLTFPITIVVPGTTVNSVVANCAAITGNVTASDNVTAVGYLDNSEVGHTDIPAGTNNFSIGVTSQFKDGESHAARVVFYRQGTSIQLGAWSGTQAPCPRSAICAADFSSNIQAVFPGNVTTLNIGDSVTVKVTMQNNGQAIWSSLANGSYALQLTPEADSYWDVSNASLVNGAIIYPAPSPSGSNDSYSFEVQLKLSAQPTSGTTPLGFQMGYLRAGGAATNFGAVCQTTLRIQSSYTPWLRVQNGNVSALDKITGQSEASRGNRDSVGAGQDINLEASAAVISIVSADKFCSTNAYNFGRTAASLSFTSGNGGAATNCSSGGYDFSLASVFGGSNDAFYQTVEGLRQASGQCSGQPDPTQANTRYKDGGTIDASSPLTVSDNCPTIYHLSGNTLNARTINRGRIAILVDGDVTITGDLKANYAAALGSGISLEPVLSGNDVAGMITAQNNAFQEIPSLGIIASGNVTIDKSVGELDAMIYAGGKINTCSAYTDGTTTGVKDAATAQQCAKRLAVKGGLYAKSGFSFGRNYFDALRIGSRIGIGGALPWTNPSFDYAGVGTDTPQGLYSGGPAEDILGSGLGLLNTPPGFEDLNSAGFASPRYVGGNFQPRF